MTAIARDEILLRATAAVYRRLPWLPGRILDWLGLEMWKGRMYSPRWARLGVRAVRAAEFPYWLLLNLGYWHQRYTYVTGRFYEREISSYLRAHLPRGATFVDVGANIGMHTLHASALVGPEGRCIAVEPNPRNFALLRAHVDGNRIANVEIHPVALGSARREAVAMRVPDLAPDLPDTESATASLRPPEAAEASGPTLAVPLETGDHLLRHVPESTVGVCKIDVEGYELEVLTGLTGFIASHPRFSYCIEITPAWLEQGGRSAAEVFALFGRLGLNAYALGERGLAPWAGSAAGEQSNVVFSRQTEI